ncbi:MAG: hypothetical protein J7578_10165 [Chitinophagaceae bacterium]|nr:hypothetical protein [Chitinophagaceae bacterium]
MQAFSSVNGGNMVDLFSGDFSYSIPLLDVGGYPVTLGYRAGSSMDDEASWVGLGWNINPGSITRNLRGLPDDFNGDTLTKVLNIKPNKTTSISVGAGLEVVGSEKLKKAGKDSTFSLDASMSVTYNNYKGWGLQTSISSSVGVGLGAAGSLSGGLSVANSTMDGVSISPSVSLSGKIKRTIGDHSHTFTGGLTLGSTYNSRSGIKALQLSTGYSQSRSDKKNSVSSGFSGSVLSFYSPVAPPSINIPYTSSQFYFSLKVGTENKVVFPNMTFSGFQSTQYISSRDTLQQMLSYGYLNYQNGSRDLSSYLDFNREKELPYTEKPTYPHIALPYYTYDAFSMSGEGTGGMFRAYRNDVGYIYDRLTRTKDESGSVGYDIGVGDLVHAGFDLNVTNANTSTYAWLEGNPMAQTLGFRKDSGLFQSTYFRNPAEKSIVSKKFYKAMGGDNVVTEGLVQYSTHSPNITGSNNLIGYSKQRIMDTSSLTQQNVIRAERDKRTQVITYLSAKEAEAGALSKYIENYAPNVFEPGICTDAFTDVEKYGHGLIREIYGNNKLEGVPYNVSPNPVTVFVPHRMDKPFDELPDNVSHDYYSVRWYGRIKAPVTGKYVFYMLSDDGAGIKLNDQWLFSNKKEWNFDGGERTGTANLVQGELYDVEIFMTEYRKLAGFQLQWSYPGQSKTEIDAAWLFKPAVDTFAFKQTQHPEKDLLVKEKRLSSYRKGNHISEISVLNGDGRRYVYGIPVYNFIQKDVTFAVDPRQGANSSTGLVKYQPGEDNSSRNMKGKDRYYSRDEMPAYAHSFLLTGILSADYSDITGNGITDDDLGSAVKFNYSRLNGKWNPFKWRTPSVAGDSASLNEGLLTDYRDDKGSYIYGEKELWYMHSIETKTMIATFVLEDRSDLVARNENGYIDPNGAAKRLKEINLYNKSDFITSGTKAKPVKTVHFEYDYELCTGINGSATGKLTLKKVSFTYNGVKKGNGKGQNPYVFSYHANNPSYNLKSYDRWGNYKNSIHNPGATSQNPISNIEYPYALQDSALAAYNAGAWNLDSIYLPSGGSLKIDYEADDYAYVQNRRAMQLFKIMGLSGNPANLPNNSGKLYERIAQADNDIVFIKVPRAVSSKEEVYRYYLQGVEKLYFRLSVEMPTDNYSNGRKFEYIPCYAELDPAQGYGFYNSNIIWVKLKQVSKSGEEGNDYSPLVKATTQYIRLNHPSKAFPGSETGDAIDLAEAAQAVKMLVGFIPQVINAFTSFDVTARKKGYGMFLDTSRSFVRLNNPWLKKYGGGHRVKRITVYDNWDKMTGQRAAKYGQEYTYTTEATLGQQRNIISSGVAIYEPPIGAEENPFRQPIEYKEKSSVLGPVTLGYSEEPLGESLFPAAGVGYSRVRVRTINYKNRKSANGLSETRFYTAYDFPVITERTLIDVDTKKRFKNPIGNYFRINSKHYLVLSQGFKVELNDMHGKIRSEGTIAETELKDGNYITKTEYYYKTKIGSDGNPRLDNTVMAIDPMGYIDTAAIIGKDMELMMDMREQRTDVKSRNIPFNTDWFTASGIPPFWLLFAVIPIFQDEKNLFRSSGTTKLIQRYGIIDSVVVSDRGSHIRTENILYDSETGDVLMTRTRNMFNDPVYHFTYPSHWAYDGMGMAYKNIDVRLEGLTFRDGRIHNGPANLNRYFSSGDEILVFGKQQTGGISCYEELATFPNGNKIWCLDSSVIRGGTSALYFIDRTGKPYNGLDVSIRILRSGRRNIFGAVGEFTSLKNPLVKNSTTGLYELKPDKTSKIIAASSNQYRQFWKVEDVFAKKKYIDCLPHYTATGRLRCVRENGANTGYQEAEEIDINIYSGEYGQSRWVSLGFNCRSCPLKESWYVSGTVRCQVDSLGRYTGYMEREEIDTTSCGPANPRSRWSKYQLDCAQCPQSPAYAQQKDSLLKYLKEYDQYRQQQYGVTTSLTTPDNIVYSNPTEITDSSLLRLPTSEQAKTTPGFTKMKAAMNGGNFCLQNGYTLEARVKFKSLPAAGEIVKLNAINLTATYTRTDTSVVLKSVSDNYGMTRTFSNGPDSLFGLKYVNLVDDWLTVKVLVLPTRYAAYVNGRLFWDSTRNSANAILNSNNIGVDINGWKGLVDWVKLYDANGQLKYFEDYTKPASPAMPDKTIYCPATPPDCKTAFVNYYNQRTGKNFTFKQIDSVYYLYTCRNVDVCGARDSVEKIVKKFNNLQSPLRLVISARSNQVPPPPGQSFLFSSDPEMIIKDGYLTYMDTLRSVPPNGSSLNYLTVSGPSTFCTDSGYTVVWKTKMLRNDLGTFPSLGYYQDENLKFTYQSVADGYKAAVFQMYDGTSTRPTIAQGPFRISTNKMAHYDNWLTFKVKLTPTRVALYCNDTLVVDTTRKVTNPLVKFKTFVLAANGHQQAIDWVRIYDANGILQVREEFNDPTNITKINKNFLCPTPTSNCKQIFTNYFNQQNGSALTYDQIAALYLGLTGKVLEICD